MVIGKPVQVIEAGWTGGTVGVSPEIVGWFRVGRIAWRGLPIVRSRIRFDWTEIMNVKLTVEKKLAYDERSGGWWE